jgi:mannose/fructose/N-acetylgalactosamine-specific phosphotransferase system component IIC
VSIPFNLEEIALLSLLAGLLAVDERAGWQALAAHPVVSSAFVGLIFGDFGTAVSVGVVLELVWLSVLPMRGARRPDAVAGAVIGAGTACLLARHTGDPRFVFVVALATVFGLLTGELAGSIGRRIHRVRERKLGRFAPPPDGRSLRRRLSAYLIYSVAFIFGAEVLLVAIMLPLSLQLAEWLTAISGSSVATGARWWLDVIPVLGAGALILMYWHKQQNRYLVLSGAVVLLLLWIT